MQTAVILLTLTPEPGDVMSQIQSTLILTLATSVLIGYNLFYIVVELCLGLLCAI